MGRVVIFGVRDTASLAHLYLEQDGGHEVAAFAVDRTYLPDLREFEGKPVVAFEDVESAYPPAEFAMFAPMTHRRMNRDRESVVLRIKAKGYRLARYVSPRAIVPSGLAVGENAFILEGAVIQPFVRIGANVAIWSGAHVGHHSTIGDHAFLAPRAALSGHCTVGAYSFIGINATVRDNRTLGEGTFVAMGACLTRDTEPWSVYLGHPARRQESRSDAIDR